MTVILNMNGYMKLGDADYVDCEGVEHRQPTPEGHLKADHVIWAGKTEEVKNLIESLRDGARYTVMIREWK